MDLDAYETTGLSPEELELLAYMLEEEGVDIDVERTILPRTENERIPLSFAQQRLWFLDQLEPGLTAYNIPFAQRLTGQLNVGMFIRCLQAVIQRHEVLRTTFSVMDGQPVQSIAPDLLLNVPVVDVQHIPQEIHEELARQMSTWLVQRSFDLTQGALIRAMLVRLDPHEHVMLLSVHHIVFDGWSVSIFARELVALYDAYSIGTPAALPALPIQYADFAIWQRQWLQGEVLETQLAYWRHQLEGTLPVVQLPTDYPRPPIQTHRGGHILTQYPITLSKQLQALGQQEGATLFMTLLAAFHTLLYRYTGQEDLIVGSPIANRDFVELEPLIGFFVNTLLLRTRLSNRTTFRAVLQQVRNVTLEAYAHQNIPFEQLVDELQPERNLSYSPLFQVMFILQNTPLPAFDRLDLHMKPLHHDSGNAKFDITLSLVETATSLNVSLEYNLDLFDRVTIERFVRHYHTLLQGILDDPARPVAHLPLLSDSEYHQLTIDWNTTKTPYPQDICIHQLLETQVDQTPDAIAVVWEMSQLTYDALQQRAACLAAYLCVHGVGPETLVGLCVERSLDLMVGVWGILKTGGAFVPLDPAYPEARLAFMLGDTQAACVVTQERIVPHLPASPAHVICLDTDWPIIAQSLGGGICDTVQPANTAYIIYTSGSTGRPKGVQIQHTSLVNYIVASRRDFGLQSTDRLLQFASISFDTAVEEILLCLASGATLVLRTDTMLGSVSGFLQACSLLEITVLDLPTAYWHQIAAESAAQRLPLPTNLRVVVIGGEQALPDRVAQWNHYTDPDIRLFNTYGPTETTIATTCWDLSAGASNPATPDHEALIGRPIANTQMYVLDTQFQPVPVGVSGELCVGGDGLSRGYLHRPAVTAERFVPNPFGAKPASRLYRTGDLARYRPCGALEFLGRLDHQVKLRGFRIEVGEIETTLTQHRAVHDAVVQLTTYGPDDHRLVAYVVPTADQSVTSPQAEHALMTQLHEQLHTRLPHYMIPGMFVILDQLPLTSNGKIDRRALPDPMLSTPDTTDYFVAPRNPTEELLAHLWMQILKREQVGIHDNFFTLGGHSLLATQLAARIRDTFKVELPLRTIFESPTVAALARRFLLLSNDHGSHILLEPASRERELPLSFAQQRLWFLDQLSPGLSNYNIPLAIRLTGQLDLDALQQSFDHLIVRHEVLRTTFQPVQGRPTQVIATELVAPIAIVNLQHTSLETQSTEANRLMQTVAQQPFDLARGPLIRMSLIYLDEHKQVLVLVLHHIIADAWSLDICVRELAMLYEAFTSGTPAVLPDLPIQYADFAVWQRTWLQGAVLEQQLGYWKTQLGGELPVLALATDRPRPPVQTFRGGRQSITLPDTLRGALISLSQREGVTLFMTLLVAFQSLLMRYSGQRDMLVGTPIAGRTHTEVEGLIGFFVNTLVLRTQFDVTSNFTMLLRQVREITLEAYAHQDLPFERLVEEIHPHRDLSRSPLFQVMFALQNVPTDVYELPGLTMQPVPVHTSMAQFDLALAMIDYEGELRGTLTYNVDLFDPTTIANMRLHFQTLLEHAVAHPACAVVNLPLLTTTERQQLLEWSSSAHFAVDEVGIHQLFEAQATQTPDAVAVIHRNAQLTYATLNRCANALAQYLQTHGVKPGSLVGVCTLRTPTMLVGILGILKAGTAYVPLDPTYPTERMSFILADTQATMVLTEEQIADALPVDETFKLCLDATWESIANTNHPNPPDRVVSDQIAYIIYTSGSTGRPKGVALTHGNATAFLHWALQTYTPTQLQGVLAGTSVCFDLSIFELFVPLSCGGTVILADDVLQLSQIDARDRVTLINTVPSAIAALLRISTLPESVHTVNLAGEPLPRFTVDQLYEQPMIQHVYNLYGPSETTTYSTYAHIPQTEGLAPTIGRPIANTQVYVLDAQLEPVPNRIVGELYIGGAGVAQQYYNRPALTAERFMPNPLSSQAGSRWYKTGDLARYKANGIIEFLGRSDHQVKIRGFRIEPGELEHAFLQHSAIQEAVIHIGEDATGSPQLIAYLVPKELSTRSSEDNRTTQTHALRRHLQTTLPAYMLPSAIIWLEALPRTPNGKINRHALPAPDGQRTTTVAYVAPRTPIESTIVAIMKHVLNLKQIGVHDHFFTLGGHSLLATQLIAHVNDSFQVDLPLRAVFESPTVAELAEAIEAAQWVARSVELESDDEDMEEGEL